MTKDEALVQLADLLIDIIDGNDACDLQYSTGLSIEYCQMACDISSAIIKAANYESVVSLSGDKIVAAIDKALSTRRS